MTATAEASHDAVVIGGGFYGVAIAVYLAAQRGLRNIVLAEQGATLLSRASCNNQARVHNGYHYPRSYSTAFRSRVNLPRFVQSCPDAIRKDFVNLYAIARNNSKVTAKQFVRFCREIGAAVEPADPALFKLFNSRLIENVFLTEEYVFDVRKLASWAERELNDCGIHLSLQTRVTEILRRSDGGLDVVAQQNGVDSRLFTARYVFNCAYSGINQIGGDYSGTRAGIKQELAELALIRVPENLKGLGVTVMDGAFFSLMPFPARELHTLSHVRYTPHMQWNDSPGTDPYAKLNQYDRATRADRMLRDAGRYLPAILHSSYVDSLFEVKSVLVKNEGDDGRPILFEKQADLPGCYTVLGGKIDNIFDVLEKLSGEAFECKAEK